MFRSNIGLASCCGTATADVEMLKHFYCNLSSFTYRKRFQLSKDLQARKANRSQYVRVEIVLELFFGRVIDVQMMFFAPRGNRTLLNLLLLSCHIVGIYSGEVTQKREIRVTAK